MSPHQEVAEMLVKALRATSLASGSARVERTYGVKDFLGSHDDNTTTRIAVMVSSVESQREGPVRNDDVTLSIIYFRRLDKGAAMDAMDKADENVEALRVWLEEPEQKRIVLIQNAGRSASRINTTLPTPYSAEHARTQDNFAAVVQTTYQLTRVL